MLFDCHLFYISSISLQKKCTRERSSDVCSSNLPQRIKNAREAVQEGTMTITDLRNIENEAIQKLVDKQVSVGLKSVTDGEFRRSWWHIDFIWGFEGVEKDEPE